MSSLNFFETNSQSSHLTVLKLQDDGSNWADYAPRLQKAMGARDLWRHVEGKATVPKPYELVNGRNTGSTGWEKKASEDQIERKEMKLMEFERQEYFAQHIILSTTLTRLGAKMGGC